MPLGTHSAHTGAKKSAQGALWPFAASGQRRQLHYVWKLTTVSSLVGKRAKVSGVGMNATVHDFGQLCRTADSSILGRPVWTSYSSGTINSAKTWLPSRSTSRFTLPTWPPMRICSEARCRLVGPYNENTDVLWIAANLANGLWGVPYYWAGVFVLEVARFMYPQQHFGLVDNDCVPVTLFEVPDLVALATSQMQWTDLVGKAPYDPKHNDKVGLLLVTEAHLEHNAGLVISIGSRCRPSPITRQSNAEVLAEELADHRFQLLAMARPPTNPTDCSQGATMFTPLVGVPMENSLDLVIVWAMYGSFMCKTFWPMPPLRRRLQATGCLFVGPRRPTQEPYQKRDKHAHRGSPGGHVPPLSKGASPFCRTWKAHAKRCPCQGNICSRLPHSS